MRYEVALTLSYEDGEVPTNVYAKYRVDGPESWESDEDTLLRLAWNRLVGTVDLPGEDPVWATAQLCPEGGDAHMFVYQDSTPWEVHRHGVVDETEYEVIDDALEVL